MLIIVAAFAYMKQNPIQRITPITIGPIAEDPIEKVLKLHKKVPYYKNSNKSK
jgi:hypothetical protein